MLRHAARIPFEDNYSDEKKGRKGGNLTHVYTWILLQIYVFLYQDYNHTIDLEQNPCIADT